MPILKSRFAKLVSATFATLVIPGNLPGCQEGYTKPIQEAPRPKPGNQDVATPDKTNRPGGFPLGERLPEGAFARLGSSQWRNLGHIRAGLLFCNDGQTVVVQDLNRVQAIDYETGRVRWLLNDFVGDVAMASMPGGQVLVGDSHSARIIDRESGKEQRRLAFRIGGQESVVANDRFVAIHDIYVTHPMATIIYDLNSGEELWHHGGLRDPDGNCHPVGFVPVNSKLVLRTYEPPETGIRVLDNLTRKTLREWKLPRSKQAPFWPTLRLSPNGQLLFVGIDNSIRLWDVVAGKEISSWPGHTDDVTQAAFTADSKLLVTAGKDGTLRWWDIAKGKELGKIAVRKPASTLAVSPDGRRAVAVCRGEGTLRRFDLKAGRELPLADGHTNRIEQLAFLPDGSRLLTASLDGTLRVWDLLTRRNVLTWTPTHMSLNWLAISPDGNLAATAGYNDGIICVYEIASGKEMRSFTPPFQVVGGIAFAPTGSTLAAGGTGVKAGEDLIRFWNAETGELIKKLPGQAYGVGRVSFTSDARRLISNASDKAFSLGIVRSGTPAATSQIWDLATERALRIDSSLARDVVPAPNGYSVAVIRLNQDSPEFCLVELASGRERLKFAIEGSLMGPVVFSSDGRLLATAGPYLPRHSRRLPGVYLWDTAYGKEFRRLGAGEVWSLAFSPDGKTLATGGLDGTVLLWDLTKTRPPVGTSSASEDAIWSDLAADAPHAYQAILTVSQLDDRGVTLLRQRLKPAVPVDPRHLAQLLDDLDDKSFTMRQKAATELEALNDRAAEAMKERLLTTQSPEARRSIQQLLDKLDGYLTEPNLLREVRAIEALERSKVPSSLQLLQQLATGDPAARLTREAITTLALKKREMK